MSIILAPVGPALIPQKVWRRALSGRSGVAYREESRCLAFSWLQDLHSAGRLSNIRAIISALRKIRDRYACLKVLK